MREILFRGKRTDNGEWIEGYLVEKTIFSIFDTHLSFVIYKKPTNIYHEEYREIDPSTVGQYTGLTDKNGTKIFEGDIVKCCDMIGKIKFENGAFGIATNDTIDYQSFEDEIKNWTFCDNEPYFCYCDNFVSFQELMWNYNLYEGECDIVEVIGNIHDTPELLEAENVLPSKKRRH